MAHWTRAVGLFTLAAGLLTAQTPAKSALDKVTFEAYLRHLNLWGPQINVQIADPKPSTLLPGFQDVTVKASLGERSLEATYQVSADGRRIVQGNIYDIADSPFREELALLKPQGAPSLGPDSALVEISVFSDFQCSYCQQLAKTLRENLEKSYPAQVRLVFRDYPLDAIHPWARAASIAGRCIASQDAKAFWAYHDWIFEQQASITPETLKQKVLDWAAGRGLDTIRLGPCLEARATEPEIEKSLAQGRALRVGSTPTLFVNGRRLTGSVEWAQLKNIIDTELKHAESCCSIELKPGAGSGDKK
jgi:protein-disulfide isomerase